MAEWGWPGRVSAPGAPQATPAAPDLPPVTSIASLDLLPLRAERQRLLGEVERLTWLRRLVLARRDVEVARLGGFGPGLWSGGVLPDVVRAALEHDPGLGAELLSALCASQRALGAASADTQRHLDSATGELVRRYRAEPSLCLTTIGSAGR